jgi:hypothetical protein
LILGWLEKYPYGLPIRWFVLVLEIRRKIEDEGTMLQSRDYP